MRNGNLPARSNVRAGLAERSTAELAIDPSWQSLKCGAMTPFLISAFATLFVVIDPPGLVPLYMALTQGMSPERRTAMARRACIIAFVLLTLFGLFGETLLGFIGISMSAFRIAGGMLLFLTALDMLFERRTQRREGQTADPDHDPSVFPLATPLIAGPGAIASMILLMGQAPDWSGKVAVLALLAAMIVATFLFLLAAPPIERLMGRTGTIVVTRLLGMLLAALAVQFVIDGIRGIGFLGLGLAH
jgi:multiple antibiotic resistance protein